MESPNYFYQIFTTLATQLPSLLTMLGAIVVAINRWKRHPRVSLTVVIAMGLILLHVLFFAFVYAILPTLTGSAHLTTLRIIQTLVSVAYNLALAIFTTILLGAIFMHRNVPPPPPSYEPAAEARAA